jgi:hypothetical protein
MTTAAPMTASNTVTYQGNSAAAAAAPADGWTFGEVLSDLNPLQYVPVVGTIYRAVTGDTIPKPLREAGSLVVSGLIGGPIGIATNLATLALEKLTGIDLEDVGQSVLASLRPADAPEPSVAASQSAAAALPAATASAPDVSSVQPGPWTGAQLAAYGIVQLPDGDLQQGDLIGADVLNALQLRAAA